MGNTSEDQKPAQPTCLSHESSLKNHPSHEGNGAKSLSSHFEKQLTF